MKLLSVAMIAGALVAGAAVLPEESRAGGVSVSFGFPLASPVYPAPAYYYPAYYPPPPVCGPGVVVSSGYYGPGYYSGYYGGYRPHYYHHHGRHWGRHWR
jgi:hypothetical protein